MNAPGHNDEFDLYCERKPPEARERLALVRQLILDTVPEVCEGRVHLYLVYHFGGGAVAKLHLDAEQQVNITFVTGEDLTDPSRLLKGSSPSVRSRSPRMRFWIRTDQRSRTSCDNP